MKQEQCTSLPDTAVDSLPTLFLDTSQLSLLNGMDTPAKFSENEQQTDGSPACECMKGMSACSIHPSTPEKWTAFMQDSLAKTLALLENRQAYMREPDQVFTAKSCGSLAWYDQGSSSWKTYQQSLITDWEPYSETWPRWGMTQGGSAYVHPMSERRITETGGSGFAQWATPNTMDSLPSRSYKAMKRQATNGGRKNRSRPSNLREQIDPLMCQAYDEARMEANQPKYLPTPQARDYRSGDKPGSPRSIRKLQQGWSMNLNDWVMFPTPTTIDAGTGRFNTSVGSSNNRPTLAMMAKKDMWPTPTAHNAKETNAPSETNRNTPTLAAQIGGKLSPLWVEWLMGFPIGFTVSKDWVTPKSRSKQPPPTDFSGDSDAP